MTDLDRQAVVCRDIQGREASWDEGFDEAMGDLNWKPAELARVQIPAQRAQEHGTESRGTVVWYVPGAAYATVECNNINGRPGLDTTLIDVPVGELAPEGS